MAKELSIKVKVDLPTAGDLESKLNKMLGGKDLNANVKVNAKIGKLGNLKSQIRRAIGNEKFNARVGVKVSGMGELNRLASQIEKVRRLASEPIKMKVDTGGTGFDQQIDEARAKAKDMGETIAKSQSSAMVAAQKEMRQAQNEMARTYAEMQRSEARAIKAKSDADTQVYKQSQERYQNQLRQQEAAYRRMRAAQDPNLGSKEVDREISKAERNPKVDQSVHLARNAQAAREAAAAWKEYSSAVKAAYKAESRAATKQAGSHELAELNKQVDAYKAKAAEIKRVNQAIFDSDRYSQRAARLSANYDRNMALIRARQADGVYESRRPRMRSRGGLIPTMDIGGALQTGAMGIASVISQLNDVDKAITKVTKVVPDSQVAVNKWKKNIYRDAAEVGKTAPEFASAVEQWVTAGYNLKQSNRLAKTSVMGSFVGEVPVNDMVRYMSVPLKAFNKEGLKSTDIVNAMNQVSNKHAIEMDDLGQAYQKASSTMAATGTTFAQTTGIITAAQEGTRAGGEAIGTAFKTISANLAQIGSGLTGQAKNKDKFFNGLGVQLKDSKGNLKSTYQIMDQLSKKWKTMSKSEKNTAALYAGGKNHANIFSATMDNWDTARKAALEAQEQKGLGSSGSAYQEMAKQKQSIEFQLKGLQDMWGQFIQNLSGGRKGIGDVLSLVSMLGGGLLKLSSNPLLSSTVRWGTLAAGALLARRAFTGMAAGLGEVVLQGKKGDSLINRLAGLDEKAQKWHDNTAKLHEAWGELTGKKKVKSAPITNNSHGEKVQGGVILNSTPDSFKQIDKETKAQGANTRAKQKSISTEESVGKSAKQSAQIYGVQADAIGKNTAKTNEHIGKVRRMGNVLKATAGVASAMFGYVGLAMDAATLAGMAMEAMGIHPMKMLKKAMDPAGESAKVLNKRLDQTVRTSERLASQGEKFSGRVQSIKAENDAAKDLRDTIDSVAASGAKSFDKDTFGKIKSEYDSLAKANGIKLSIDSNDVQQAQQRLQQLQDLLKMSHDDSVSKLSDNIDKAASQNGKHKKGQGWQDLLDSDKKYSDSKRAIAKRARYEMGAHFDKEGREYALGRRKLEDTSVYKKMIGDLNDKYSYGSNNRRIWNTSQGRKALKASRNNNQTVRDDMAAMAAGINNGGITSDYIKSQASYKERRNMALSEANLLRSLRGSKDSDAIKSAENGLKTVLNAMGKGGSFNAIRKLASGGIGNWTKWALKQGAAGESILGVDAQYKSQYSNWRKALQKQANTLQRWQSKKGVRGSEKLADSFFEDENGNVNIANMDRLNASKINDKKYRSKLEKGLGIKYDGNHIDMTAAKNMAKYAGSGDPVKLGEQLATGKANLNQVVGVALGNKLSPSKFGEQVAQFAKGGSKHGELNRTQFKQALDKAVNNGAMSADDVDKQMKWYNKNFTKNGTAKTANMALKAAEGKAQLTNKQLQSQLKALKNDKEREKFVKGLHKNGQLSDNQWKKYKDADWDKFDRQARNAAQRRSRKSNNSSFPLLTAGDWSGSGKGWQGKLANKIDRGVQGLFKKNGLFGKNGWFGKIGNGFKRGGIFGGLGNLAKMDANAVGKFLFGKRNPFAKNGIFSKIGNGFAKNGFAGGLGNLAKMGLNGAGKFLFGKNFKMPDFSKMFRGLNKIKLPNLNKALGGLKKIKMPNFSKMFKGLNKIKMPNFKKMFGGAKNPLDKLFGKGSKGHKVKLQADTKGLSKSISKIGKGKGTKVKLQADTKALSKSISRLGKGKGQKVKLQADTKALSKSLSNLGKGKGQKIKLQADTRSLSRSLKGLKGLKKSQKIKITAGGNALSKVRQIKTALRGISGKSKKITINAGGNALSKVKQIKSALHGIKGSKHISLTASGNAKSVATKVKSAVSSIPSSKHINISASGNAASMAKRASSAINSIPSSHKTNITAHDGASGKARAAASAINAIPTKHNTHITVTGDGAAIAKAHSVASAINSIPSSKSVTISVTKNETHVISEKHKGKSVVIDPQQATQPVNPLTSMSVVAGNPSLAQALDASAANMGVDVNSAMNGQKVTDYSDSTEKVSEDYWRYMGNQLYTGLPLDEQVNKLESAVTQADDNMDKLITLSRQRIDVDRKQISYQETMQRAYQQQVTDMINQLHAYGFQNNGNQITNLDHAKSITGDNASKVDDLLSKYQSAYQNMSEAAQKIEELRTDIWQQGKNQEDYRNTKDQKMVDQLQRELEILTTSIDNSKNILERQADSLSDGDYVMKMKNGAEQINDKTEAVYQLLQKFNRLSVANFVGTKDADNAKNLLESLQSIRDSVTENLDSIDELKKSMRDTTLNSIIENLDKYTTNLSDSIDRLKNNVENLQDGLLSGTTYSDLMSSNFDVVNLHQKSAYEESVNERIDLEKAMDDALDRFAQKNVDRTAQVANQELQINQQKYDSLYKMAEGYANGQLIKSEPIRVKYEKQTETDQIDLPGVSHNQEYVKASTEYQKQMADLKARYNDEMSKATSQEEREAINQRMVYEQLSLQEATNKRMIEADKQAIEDLKKQAQDPGMSTEQLTTISDKIAEYEKNIIDAQNDIKDAVKSRFEYEKTQLDKEMDDYQRLSDTMSNLVTIADALHLDGKTQAAVIDQQYAATYMQYDNYLNVLERLRNEMSKYEKGSFERNQLQDMINDYQSSLDGIVTSLLDITKSEFEQTLDSVQKSFEKSVNKGMTADQAKFDQDVWYNPMQKELKLEEMRLKITELEDKTVEKRIAALDAQERMSKAEADYVDKQLDLALAEQKLNNTINKKDVRYLEKDENGKFNWTYIADQDQVDAARQEVNQAKQAIEDAKVSNRNDYIEKVEEIVSDMKDGSINQEEVRSRLEQLNNSYKFILKDIPTFDISKVEDIIKAYDEYEEKNQNIIKDYQRSANVQNKAAYQDIVKGFGDQFKAVSKDLGEIFGKQLRETLNLPNGIRNAYGTGKDQSLVINGGLHIELPDVKDVDDFAKAIETLPQVAKQYATRK